jgi:hypothetical protein
MAIDINIPIENAVTDGSLNPVTSNAVFDGLALKANSADLATVATSGDYNDLSNLPSIPAAQVNADWNATSGVAEILNKPTIPSVTGFVPYTGATNDVNLGVHDLTATQGTFATSGSPDTLTVNHSSGSGKALTITKGGNGEGVYVNKTSGSGNAVTIIGDLEATNIKRTGGTSSQFLKANGSIDSTSYQPTLVSATNIKTVNGNSLLGSGDLVVGGGITVGTTAVTSGTVGRIFFQGAGNVVQQSSILTFDTTTGDANFAATFKKTGSNFAVSIGASDIISTSSSGANLLLNTSFQISHLAGNNHGFYDASANLIMSLNSANRNVGIGATPASTVRLDVRAKGALSTDIAFRVRNSADTGNLFEVLGNNVLRATSLNLGATPSSFASSPYLTIHNGALTSASFANFSNNSFSLDVDRFMNIGINGGNGNTTGTGSILLGLGQVPSSRNFQLTVAGLTGFSQGTNDSGFAQTGADTTGNNAMYVNYIGKNWTIGGTNQGNGKRVFAIINGTEPSNNITDAFQLYSADITAGNAAPHFRTENGNIIKLYRETTGIAAAAFVSNTSLIVNDSATYGGYTMGQVVAALKAQGLLT